MKSSKKRRPPKLKDFKEDLEGDNGKLDLIRDKRYMKKRQKDKATFRVFSDEFLDWPLNSFLIQNENQIIPKNGGGIGRKRRRICLEQDY